MSTANNSSRAFDILHPNVKEWVWKQNWLGFRKIQEEAIPIVLEACDDLVISAATAAGKTEAAFVPICSSLAEQPTEGVGVLYISPLKALINDQFYRLESLFNSIDLPLTPWHGDVSESRKKRLRENPSGGLLITPESLEAFIMHRAHHLKRFFSGLRFIVVDEFHEFIGSERGQQLLSLLHRLEFLIRRLVPRIALSATLGDLQMVMNLLRPEGGMSCRLISSEALRQNVRLQLRGYLAHRTDPDAEEGTDKEQIVEDLFRQLRGSSNLAFANSRSDVELFAVALREACERNGCENEFFPHHGNLSKNIREFLEKRLKEGVLPTTAVCTSTLELGIDIGQVTSIAQVGIPPSVSSMRQRLGRSGRRGDPAIIRLYISEKELDIRSHPVDLLRVHLLQTVAMVELMVERWYEPPRPETLHLSTLVQQVLSLLFQYGGIQADQAYNLLCASGPFRAVSPSQFALFLRSLATSELITQTHDGCLVLGLKGERVASHYSFYAAFQTPEEYRLEAEGYSLGTLPILYPITKDDYLIFAGKRWQVQSVDEEKKLIQLRYAYGGKPPHFGGEGQMVHRKIREKMASIYCGDSVPDYLNPMAKALIREGRESYQQLLSQYAPIFSYQGNGYALIWLGDDAVYTLNLIFKHFGINVARAFNVLEFPDLDADEVQLKIRRIREYQMPSPLSLVKGLPSFRRNKHDHFVADELLSQECVAAIINMDDAVEWLRSV